MNYFIQLRGLMIEVMLPPSLLVAAGALWPRIFADAQPDGLRTQLNRVVMYVFYPCVLFAVACADHGQCAVGAAVLLAAGDDKVNPANRILNGGCCMNSSSVPNKSSIHAPFFYMVTFEIAPEDEKDFNEIYDTEHIPNILQVEGVLQVIRLRDAEPTAQGWLQYSALYLITQPDLPTTPQWKAKSDLGRWAPLIRPRVKSRRQRLGATVAYASRP